MIHSSIEEIAIPALHVPHLVAVREFRLEVGITDTDIVLIIDSIDGSQTPDSRPRHSARIVYTELTLLTQTIGQVCTGEEIKVVVGYLLRALLCLAKRLGVLCPNSKLIA